MQQHRFFIGVLMSLAVLAGSIHAPVIYHRTPAGPQDQRLHVVVHNHQGRVHLHVHEHEPMCCRVAHAAGGDTDQPEDGRQRGCSEPRTGHCDACGLQECCHDDTTVVWLSAERDDDWREHFLPVPLKVGPVWEAAANSSGLDAHVHRPGEPPGFEWASYHLARVRPMILRL